MDTIIPKIGRPRHVSAWKGWSKRWRLCAKLCALGVTSSPSTHAAPDATSVAERSAQRPAVSGRAADASEPRPDGESTEAPAEGWPFRNFELADYLATGAVSVIYYTIEITQDGPRGADWTEPWPLDAPFRDFIVGETRSKREWANVASDYFWAGSVAYSVVAPPILGAYRYSSANALYQISLMNLQAYMLTSLLIRMPHKWLGRTRPSTLGCAEDPEYDALCGTNSQYAGFPSGHTAVSMTGAGLSCAHHLHGELLGHPAADWAVCGTTIAMASTVGALRMISDRHWLSDTLIGGLQGFAVGYFLPTLLYYHPFWQNGEHVNAAPSQGGAPQSGTARVVVLPYFDSNGFVLQAGVVGW